MSDASTPAFATLAATAKPYVRAPLPPGEVDATRVAAGEGDVATQYDTHLAAAPPSSGLRPPSPGGRRVLAGAFFLVATLCAPAAAKETLVQDVAEFDAAVKAAQAGDEIVMADGEWRDVDLIFRGAGTRNRPIVLRAQTPGKVLLLGTSRLRFGGEYLTARDLLWRDSAAKDDVVSFRYDSKTLASHCVLLQCAILGDVPDKERKFVSLYGERNSVFRCRFEGKKSKGTLLVVWLGEDAPPSGHVIAKNFFGPRERLGKNGGEIIRVGDSDTSLQDASADVMNNYFFGCSGEAEIISNKSCDNRYKLNTFVGCGGALTLRHGNRCHVTHNLFLGDGVQGTGGVRVIGEGHLIGGNLFHELLGDDTRAALCIMNGVVDSPANGYLQVRDVDVIHNEFIDCKESFVIGNADDDQQRQTLPPTDCRLTSNTVTSDGRPVFTIRTPPVRLECSDNSYWGGELGLDPADGWEKKRREAGDLVARLRKPDPENFQLLDGVGPAWMRPGDEFLPKVLQAAQKTEATQK